MSGLVLLGLLWAAVGILLGFRWWHEREQPPAHHAARAEPAIPAPSPTRFGQLAESRAEHRRQAMLLAYAVGTSLVALGFLLRAPLPLAFGAALVNLGTLYRYLVLLLDEAPAEEAAVAGPAHRRTGRRPVSPLVLGEAK